MQNIEPDNHTANENNARGVATRSANPRCPVSAGWNREGRCTLQDCPKLIRLSLATMIFLSERKPAKMAGKGIEFSTNQLDF